MSAASNNISQNEIEKRAVELWERRGGENKREVNKSIGLDFFVGPEMKRASYKSFVLRIVPDSHNCLHITIIVKANHMTAFKKY